MPTLKFPQFLRRFDLTLLPVATDDTNIVYGSIERSVSLKSKSGVDHMGVSIEGGLARARAMTFSISAVHARTFKNGPAYASMFAATEAGVSFETSGNVDLAADVDAADGVSVHGGGGVQWTGKRSFKITKNEMVPFAFRGWRV